ncbi:tetrahydromethanopterin S-methyltransferase subunit D [Methanolapillus millepedarum]|uniref:Tetrahydromethanopterin S-methyltransferase subunit D n=1 Tax=Methanolapillus millepedarum TaxID=3028296 RepID=A0AA96V625_9EURY|nr:hypothetical protein MsAc7_13340 [Methanosarcinaceae archaeon Ac7]
MIEGVFDYLYSLWFIEILWAFLIFTVLITIGGVLISLSVHFIPVGGAPAAMAQATGVGTGTTQLAAGAGLTGLLVSASVSLLTNSFWLILCLGAIGSALMIVIVMFMANIVYVYGVGCTPASGKLQRDPVTKDRQDIYVSKGTEGHGIPTICFISGILGGLLGGFGGALIFELLYIYASSGRFFDPITAVSLAVVLSIALFFINAVIASYNIAGTIEGYHDPKFKKWPKAVIVSAVMTFICSLLCFFAVGNIGGIL